MAVTYSPFPWYGGKARVAEPIWQRFGANVRNYVEPFAGSLAVLLARKSPTGFETVNDLDCYVANFWRALHTDAEAVSLHADWPVNETDLLARHDWLVGREEFRKRMCTDPDYFDVKIAGWWVWGISQWIGSGWCQTDGRTLKRARPYLTHGMGVHAKDRVAVDQMRMIAYRLRRVRVCCGEWDRVLGPSPLYAGEGITAVMLDPPYADTAERYKDLYSKDSFAVAHRVRDWAIAHGSDKRLRIALCGYDNEHNMPSDWECLAWKSGTGAGKNPHRERVWFSPHCLHPGA